MKVNKKIIAITILLLFSIKNSYAEIPTFDATAAANAVQGIQSMQQMIEHNTEMAKQLGDGKLTPQTINWASDWYFKCGGGKFVLPDWFPYPKLNICADGNKEVELGVDWYEKEFLIKTGKYGDSEQVAKVKSQKKQDALRRIRAYSLSKSVLEMQRSGEDEKAIKELQDGLKGSKDQVSLQKIQTQVMIQMLAELQKINIKQAEMIHIMAIKD